MTKQSSKDSANVSIARGDGRSDDWERHAWRLGTFRGPRTEVIDEA